MNIGQELVIIPRGDVPSAEVLERAADVFTDANIWNTMTDAEFDSLAASLREFAAALRKFSEVK